MDNVHCVLYAESYVQELCIDESFNAYLYCTYRVSPRSRNRREALLFKYFFLNSYVVV